MSGYRMVLATAKGGAKLCYIAFGFRTDGLEEAQKSFQAWSSLHARALRTCIETPVIPPDYPYCKAVFEKMIGCPIKPWLGVSFTSTSIFSDQSVTFLAMYTRKKVNYDRSATLRWRNVVLFACSSNHLYESWWIPRFKLGHKATTALYQGFFCTNPCFAT